MGTESVLDASKWISPLCWDRNTTFCQQPGKCYPMLWDLSKTEEYLLDQSTSILKEKRLLFLQMALGM